MGTSVSRRIGQLAQRSMGTSVSGLKDPWEHQSVGLKIRGNISQWAKRSVGTSVSGLKDPWERQSESI